MTKNYRVPVRKNGIETFNNIIEASKGLFAINGVRATSINEIIEKSGVATGTFYQYFDDKIAVYEYLLDWYQGAIRDAIRKATKHSTSRLQTEREGLKAYLTFAREDNLAYQIIWESMFVNPKLFRDYYISFARSYVIQLQKALSKQEIRDDIDLETLAYSLMGIANFTGLQVIFKDPTDHDIDFITGETMKLIEAGIFKK